MNTTMSGPDAFCTEAPVPHANFEWFWPSRRPHAYDEFCR
jgi:hypothetical protein